MVFVPKARVCAANAARTHRRAAVHNPRTRPHPPPTTQTFLLVHLIIAYISCQPHLDHWLLALGPWPSAPDLCTWPLTLGPSTLFPESRKEEILTGMHPTGDQIMMPIALSMGTEGNGQNSQPRAQCSISHPTIHQHTILPPHASDHHNIRMP